VASELESRHRDADVRHPGAGTAVPPDRHRDADLEDGLYPRSPRERRLAGGWLYVGLIVGAFLMAVLAERRRRQREVEQEVWRLRGRVLQLEGRAVSFATVDAWHRDAHGVPGARPGPMAEGDPRRHRDATAVQA
jgi:hypothetical protein